MARMDRAIEIYEKLKTRPSRCGYGPCLATLSAGTPHVPPPRDSKNYPLYESSVGAKYLLKAGIPPTNIVEEKISLDTLGNVIITFLFVSRLTSNHIYVLHQNRHIFYALYIQTQPSGLN